METKNALASLERIADANADSLFAALETVARAVFADCPDLEKIDAAQGVEFVTYGGERLDLATDCPDDLEPLRAALDAWDSASPGTSPGLMMTRADAEPVEPEPDTFERFAADLGLTIEAQAVSARPDTGDSDWNQEASHFHVTLKRTHMAGGFPRPSESVSVVWSGHYSTGAGHPLMWARDGAKLHNHKGHHRTGAVQRHTGARRAFERMGNRSGFGRVSVDDAGLLDTIRDAYRAAAPLQVADILQSLQCDSRDWDCTFEDWVDCLGYDRDSRRAESVFHACQNTAKTIRAALGADNFERFLNLEESC